ncbi:hypothetical protein ACJEBH_22345 [Pseudomonas guariconensis]|uniref:hypothetical protein n=1 Tax=Pseudomonas guariconensis TaxID=1288410 RepID=UPI00387179C6
MAIRVWWFCQTSSQASQARRPLQEGQLRKAVGALAGAGGESRVADGHRLADQVPRNARTDHLQGLVEWAAEFADGAVQPEAQHGLGQGARLCLAQAVGGAHVGVGQVQLQVPGAKGLQAVGEGAAQLL